MERTFILSNIYTSENNSYYIKDEKMYSHYPMCAGTLEGVEAQLKHIIENAEAKGLSVEEITSEDIHAGQYFDKVVKIQNKIGGPSASILYGVYKSLPIDYKSPNHNRDYNKLKWRCQIENTDRIILFVKYKN